MANQLPGSNEANKGAVGPSQAAEPSAPAEPRSVRSESLRDLTSKHANDRRTLDRVLARMRER